MTKSAAPGYRHASPLTPRIHVPVGSPQPTQGPGAANMFTSMLLIRVHMNTMCSYVCTYLYHIGMSMYIYIYVYIYITYIHCYICTERERERTKTWAPQVLQIIKFDYCTIQFVSLDLKIAFHSSPSHWYRQDLTHPSIQTILGEVCKPSNFGYKEFELSVLVGCNPHLCWVKGPSHLIASTTHASLMNQLRPSSTLAAHIIDSYQFSSKIHVFWQIISCIDQYDCCLNHNALEKNHCFCWYNSPFLVGWVTSFFLEITMVVGNGSFFAARSLFLLFKSPWHVA